jgi:hypothetical protein
VKSQSAFRDLKIQAGAKDARSETGRIFHVRDCRQAVGARPDRYVSCSARARASQILRFFTEVGVIDTGRSFSAFGETVHLSRKRIDEVMTGLGAAGDLKTTTSRDPRWSPIFRFPRHSGGGYGSDTIKHAALGH